MTLLLLLPACSPAASDTGAADGETDTDTDTGSEPTWAGDIYPIELGSCADCHRAWGQTSNAVYTWWTTQSKDGVPLITPGDPAQSYVYLKLTDPSGGKQMPLQVADVSASDLAGLEAWIESGAQNDEAFLSSMAHIYDVYACDDCHDDWAARNDTDGLYAKIMGSSSNGYPYVDPGNARGSFIFLKVAEDAPPDGARMPRGVDPLTTSQIASFELWITAGASDN